MNIADELAKKQKEISVSEFFERNKQLLGFDSPTRAVITSVKEAVDNSLDACEEAGILPDIEVSIEEVNRKKNVYRLVVEDNGPGIVRKQIPHVFGRLLYGSRFHAIRQSRGQQGIGISAVVMYSQLTTGRASVVRSKTGPSRAPHEVELKLYTKTNRPDVLRDEVVLWDEKEHGTRFECHLVARYQRGRQSAYEYLRATAIVNPHAQIVFREPDGRVITFHRATDKLPHPASEILPHPHGIMLGTLLKMARATKEHKMANFLRSDFSRVSPRVAKEVCAKAFVDPDTRPADLAGEQGERLLQAFHEVKIMAPPTDCLSPIGPLLIRKGLKKETKSDFIVTTTRPANVYSGHPFQVEVGLVYGGDLPKESPVQILRFANRVPLLYQQGGCAVTRAIEQVNWRRYGLDQRGGRGIPHGPMMLLVHAASTQVPFTSESKEAIAHDETIMTECELALQEVGRSLKRHVRKKKRLAKMKDKEDLIRQVLPFIASKSAEILDRPVPPIEPIIAKIMNMVLLNGEVTYDAKGRRHQVTIEVINYTRAAKTFTLYTMMTSDLQVAPVEPRPKVQNEDLLGWRISRMPVGSSWRFSYQLMGTEPDDFSAEELDLYVEGLDPELANGVEAWDQDAYDDMHREAMGEKPAGWIEVDETDVEDAEGAEGEGEEADAGEVEEDQDEGSDVEEATDGPEAPEEPADPGDEGEPEDEGEPGGTEEEEEPGVPELDVDELEGPKDSSVGGSNGQLAEATAAPEVKLAKMAGAGEQREGEDDGDEAEDSLDRLLGSKQSAIVDFDDEFRMEASD